MYLFLYMYCVVFLSDDHPVKLLKIINKLYNIIMSSDNYYQSLYTRNEYKENTLNNGTLTECNTRYTENITEITLQLKEHQKTMIYACLKLEGSLHSALGLNTEYADGQYKPIILKSNVGVIGDLPGSGKSLVVLAIIALQPKLSPYRMIRHYINYRDMGLSIERNLLDSQKLLLSTNLILVPHTIILQWEKYITNHTKLSYMKINNKKSALFTLEKLQTVHILLVSANFIDECLDNIINIHTIDSSLILRENIVFQRVFIDEADNIKIPTGINVYGLFHWMISGSIYNLFFPSGSYVVRSDRNGNHSYSNRAIQNVAGLNRNNGVRGFFQTLIADYSVILYIWEHILCKNHPDFVKQSFDIPTLTRILYECKTPESIHILYNTLHRDELISYINANDIDSLKEKLGFSVESQTSISEMLTINFKRNLGNEIKHYEYINSLEIHEEDKADRLEKIQKKIDEMKASIEGVEERVKITADSMCPICRDTLTQPIGNTCCCKNMFCFECITSYFTSSGGKLGECPCCRAKIGLKGVTIISDSVAPKSNIQKYITKEDMFIDVLCQKNMPLAKKWLVFSSFDATFNGIIEQLDKQGVRYSKLYGNVQHIQRVINEFREGTIQVLLLNAVHFGMGLNLEMATDILIYHKMSIETEKQVIGRAQRPGRSSPLNVHYLCHTNELAEYKLRYPDSISLNCIKQSIVL